MVAKRTVRERILGLPRAVWRRGLHQWALFRARRLSIARVDAQQPRRLLVMCYGNIYRSPFVAAWLGVRLADRTGFEIRSAGFHLVPARPSPPEYIRLASDYRVDLGPHRSRIVEPADLEWADLIVIMDRYNWERLRMFGSGAQDKVIWLGAFAPDGALEIEDPYAMPLPRVQAIIEQMRVAADGLAHRLLGDETRR